MSFQIAILRVLAAHPEGRATLGALKSDLAVLNKSGPDWANRIKALAARAPDLDIFTSKFVLVDGGYWSLTASGLSFLRLLERPVAHVEALVKESATVSIPALKPRVARRAKPSRALRRQFRSLASRTA